MSAAATPGSKPYYFVPQPSHWPITGSCALLLLALGAACWFNGIAFWPWLVGARVPRAASSCCSAGSAR